MSEYFISYARSELTFADSLYQDLKDQGFDCWMDIHHLKAGEAWQTQIFDALDEARGFILIVSKESIKSPNVRDEIARAQCREKDVYLAIFEATPLQHNPEFQPSHISLPPNAPAEPCVNPMPEVDWQALRQAPFVDFRQPYQKALALLAEQIPKPAGKTSETFDPEFRMPPAPRSLSRSLYRKFILALLSTFAWVGIMFAAVTSPEQSNPLLLLAIMIALSLPVAFTAFWYYRTRQSIRNRTYRYWRFIWGTVISALVNLHLGTLGLIALAIFTTSFISVSSIIGLIVIGPFLLVLYNLFAHSWGAVGNLLSIGSQKMYRWSGSHGISTAEFQGWFRQSRVVLLMFFSFVGIAFASLFVASQANDASSPLRRFLIQFANVDIYTDVSSGPGFDILYIGFIGFIYAMILTLIIAVVVLRSTATLRKYRRRLVDPNRVPQQQNVSLEVAPQDELAAAPIRAALTKFHTLVSPAEADTSIVLLSPANTTIEHETSQTLPIMVGGGFGALDPAVGDLQVVDWRGGIKAKQVNLLTRYIDQPAQLVAVLAGFPRRGVVETSDFAQPVQQPVRVLQGLAITIFGLLFLPVLQSFLTSYLRASRIMDSEFILRTNPVDTVMALVAQYLGQSLGAGRALPAPRPELWFYALLSVVAPIAILVMLFWASRKLRNQSRTYRQQIVWTAGILLLTPIVLFALFAASGGMMALRPGALPVPTIVLFYAASLVALLAYWFWVSRNAVLRAWLNARN